MEKNLNLYLTPYTNILKMGKDLNIKTKTSRRTYRRTVFVTLR